MRKFWPILFFISLGLNVFLLFPKQSGTYQILAVLDGDTIVLENKVRVRLREVDAPELKNCGGREAKAELVRLLGKEKIDLKEQIIDTQGRPMAIIFIGNQNINLAMLKSGWAKYHHDKDSFSEVLKQAASEAKEEERGIYAKCVRTTPLNQNCVIKGNIDNNSPYEKRYYVPGCVHYNTAIVEENDGEKWFCTEREAVAAGYQKASRCP